MNIPNRIFALLLMGSLVVGCGSGKLSTSNLDKLTNGMTRAQVEAILGKPDAVEHTPEMDSCSWTSGGRIVAVTFSPTGEMLSKSTN